MFWGLRCLQWSLFGRPLASHWGTLGNLGAHFGPPGAALGRLGSALKLLWGCLGIILALIGKKASAGTTIASQWLSSTAPAHKNKPAGICMPVPRVPGVRGNGPRTTVQDLPSTRAGCQDGVSSKQAPLSDMVCAESHPAQPRQSYCWVGSMSAAPLNH